MQDQLTSYFWSGDTLRSRSVGSTIPTATLEVPALPARLAADCEREITRLGLELGDVEPLSLARARTRWPDYRHHVQAVADWTRAQGLPDLLDSSDVALMACRGVPAGFAACVAPANAANTTTIAPPRNAPPHRGGPGGGHPLLAAGGIFLPTPWAHPWG